MPFSTSGSDQFTFEVADNGIINRRYWTSASSLATPFEGSWTHVVATYDGQGAMDSHQMYVNGGAIAMTLDSVGVYTAMPETPSTLRVGKADENYADGMIDEVRIYERALTPTEVASLFATSTTSTTTTSIPTTSTSTTSTTTLPPTAQLVMHYTFDADEGGTVTDQSGNGHTGTVFGTTWVNDQLFGDAYDFDGVDDYISAEDSAAMSFGDGVQDRPFTVGAWIRMDDATRCRILSKGDFHEEWTLATSASDQFVFQVTHNGSYNRRYWNSASSLATPFEGVWAHVMATYDGQGTTNSHRMYVNGAGIPMTAGSAGTYVAMPETQSTLRLGKADANHADGMIDEVRIYERALSAGEVATIFAGHTTSTTTTSTTSTTSTTTIFTTSTTTTTSIFTTSTTSTSSTTAPLPGQHDVSFSHNGGYWSSELGDIDPGLSFGHGFLAPGSGNGARFDFWFAPDGVIDGTGTEGGGDASMGDANYATGGDDVFLGSIVMSEDGTDQYQGGAGLDIDSFAFLPGGTVNITGPGYADGTTVGYGRVFEGDNPQVGDWYYVGASQVIRDVTGGTVPPNTIPIGRAQGMAGLDPLDGTAWSFQVIRSTTPAPPVIVDMNKDGTLWSVHEPGGTITPQYSTNLGTIPIEWLSIPIFSNAYDSGTNVITFEPPNTNAPAVNYRLLWEP